MSANPWARPEPLLVWFPRKSLFKWEAHKIGASGVRGKGQVVVAGRRLQQNSAFNLCVIERVAVAHRTRSTVGWG